MTHDIEMFSEIISFIKSQFPNQDFIPLHEPRFIGHERQYVLDAIDSTFVSSVGAYVNRFEEMMASLTGAKYAVATVNGTAALHMAMLVAGVKHGDEVITQPLTFVATANSIAYTGAEPVFVDIDRNTLGMSSQKLSAFLKKYGQIKSDGFCYNKKTGKRIIACVPMHTFGFPCDINEILDVCEEWNINVIEDAAESLGSYVDGKHTGTLSLLGVFSFNGNKIVTCGGGGAIVTNDEKLAKLAKHLTTQAKVPHPWEFNHDLIGYNFRMPNLNAAFACGQLEKLNDFLISKRDLAKTYANFFKQKGINFFSEREGTRANYWLNAILLNDKKERDAFLEKTNKEGVMTRPAWTLMNKLPMFNQCMAEDISESEWIEDRLVNIPSSARVRV